MATEKRSMCALSPFIPGPEDGDGNILAAQLCEERREHGLIK